jgi:integrase
MAYIRRHKDGWRAEVTRKGHPRQSKVFTTKTAASMWAARVETAIIDGTASRWPAKTLDDAMTRYAKEVSSGKRGAREEALRFDAIRRDFPALAGKVLHQIDAADLSAWRDARLKIVAGATVQRDINLLRNVWTIAIREWGWCGESPWRKLRMPGDGRPRERVASWREVRAILRRCGYLTGQPPRTGLENVAWAFLVALRTGMRAGEIMGLEVGDIAGGVASVRQHKTMHITKKPRRVPLTHRGRALLDQLKRDAESRSEARLWGITGRSLDTLFRRVRDAVGVEGLHFHDARATFATHLARRVDALTLAKILGHRDIKQTMTYFRETEEAISARLTAPRARP